MLSINSVAIDTPSEFSVGVYDITKSERNANGNMIIEKITTKRKLELTYNYLSNSALSTLLSAIAASVTFTVSYPDPVTGAARNGTFYSGDKSIGMIDYQSGTPRWQKVKFNLIEI
jgi:hypothetical protein